MNLTELVGYSLYSYDKQLSFIENVAEFLNKNKVMRSSSAYEENLHNLVEWNETGFNYARVLTLFELNYGEKFDDFINDKSKMHKYVIVLANILLERELDDNKVKGGLREVFKQKFLKELIDSDEIHAFFMHCNNTFMASRFGDMFEIYYSTWYEVLVENFLN